MNSRLHWFVEPAVFRQAAPAHPFGMFAGSIDHMKKKLGFSYESCFVVVENEYGEFNYRLNDIETLGKKIEQEIEKNPYYLVNARKEYKQEMKKFETTFHSFFIQQTTEKTPELITKIQVLEKEIEKTTGIAHLLECINPHLESRLRHALMRKLHGTELNEAFSILTTPEKPSFAAKEARFLEKIQYAREKDKPRLAKEFIRQFGWTRGSYAGAQWWTIEEVLQATRQPGKTQQPDFRRIKKQKKELAQKLKLSKQEQQWVNWIAFLTDWQDERKKYILRGIFALDNGLKELSRQTGFPLKQLHYLLPQELSILSLSDGTAQKKALQRQKGCIICKAANTTLIFEGNDFLDYKQSVQYKHESITVLNGQCASLGNATGKVKICTTLESINQLKEREILVASMTRPEFVPAMKKACAIVTDEGGITSHAAIVARELGKPCVIGTKNATSVLKDGWIVQVKANHGQVIVLEKGESHD